MPPRRKPTPSSLPHKQSGRARAVRTDQTGTRHFRMLAGAYDSPESRSAFARLQLELEGRPHSASTLESPRQSVNDILLAFLDHAERYYRTPDGQMTSEVGEVRWSIKPVREVYGYTRAAEFGPRALATVRQHMMGLGWCRSLINWRIDRVKRAFKWAAASEELVPVTTYEALRTLTGLRTGRTKARESEPIKPVDPKHVKATLPFLTPHLRAMVELQRLTGMRPGEVCQLRLGEVDQSGEVWLHRPSQHKTAYHGKSLGRDRTESTAGDLRVSPGQLSSALGVRQHRLE